MAFSCRKRLKRFILKLNMSRTILCKLLQRKTYDVLAKKHTILLLFFGVIILLIATLHFGETMMEWSKEKYSAVFNPYNDNIVGKSFRNMLCQYVPIDVVYTWVNGTDPMFLKELNQAKFEYGFSTSQMNCSFSNCVKSHMVLVRPQLPSSVTLSDLEDSESEFNHISRIFSVSSPLGTAENITVVAFHNIETANRALEKRYFNIDGRNHTIGPAYITDSWWSQSTVMLKDMFLMTKVPFGYSEQQIVEKFPAAMKEHIDKVFYHEEKSLAVLSLSDGDALSSAMKLDNVSFENKVASIVSAYLVIELSSDHEDISASRFTDNEELRYSLRSLEKHAPWVQHVYIISNGQIPYWLNLDNPRVTIVTHEEIFPNTSHLPTFSSPAIECHLHRIPNLSEKFLYLNDDVMFGKDVWPEDFYTHTKGQKVYLSWPVPNCAEGCPASWIRDGSCDKPCNNSQCQWDGGDCAADNPLLPYQGIAMQQEGGYTSFFQMRANKNYCNDDCVDTWLADRYCDRACNVQACGFDAGDCGIENFHKLHQLMLSDSQTDYYMPEGETVGYVNFTDFLKKNHSINEGFYEDNPVVRTLAISLKYSLLGIVLHPHHNSTNITIKIKGDNQDVPFEKIFHLHVSTLCIPTSNNSQQLESALFNQTEESVSFEEFSEKNRFPKIGPISTDGLSYSSFQNINVSASQLSSNVKMEIKLLEKKFADGIITYNGFLKKKAAVIGRYVDDYEIVHQSTPFLVYDNKLEMLTMINDLLQSQNTDTSNNTKSQDVKQTSLPFPKKSSISSQTETPLTTSKPKQDKPAVYTGVISKSVPSFFKAAEVQAKSSSSASLQNYFKQIGSSSAKKLATSASSYQTPTISKRHLLDTFGGSLRHVNKLYNEAFGYEARKVPSHIAHFIDKNVMSRLTNRFPSAFDVTSSHKIRSSDDMQFAFSYYYYLMSEMESVKIEDIFDSFDTDQSGTWSDREIRTVLTRLNDLPLNIATVAEFEEHINNCSLGLTSPAVASPTPLYERYNDSKLSIVTKALVCSCKPVSDMLLQQFGQRKRNGYEVVGEDEVAFKMIHNNLSQVLGQIDDLRKNPKKFVCLNDNMKHGTQEAEIIRAVIQDFYDSLFPTRSSFELPPEYRNRFLFVNELKEWRKTRDTIRIITYLSLSALILFSFVSFWKAEIRPYERYPRQRQAIYQNRNSSYV